jgi:hypothetical protein
MPQPLADAEDRNARQQQLGSEGVPEIVERVVAGSDPGHLEGSIEPVREAALILGGRGLPLLDRCEDEIGGAPTSLCRSAFGGVNDLAKVIR